MIDHRADLGMAYPTICFIDTGIIIFFNELQASKAPTPIRSTESGIQIVVNEVQLEKKKCGINYKLRGKRHRL